MPFKSFNADREQRVVQINQYSVLINLKQRVVRIRKYNVLVNRERRAVQIIQKVRERRVVQNRINVYKLETTCSSDHST